jgi:hypothetical protein
VAMNNCADLLKEGRTMLLNGSPLEIRVRGSNGTVKVASQNRYPLCTV